MSLRPRPTRSQETIAIYEKCILELFRRYREHGAYESNTHSALDVRSVDILGIIKGKTTVQSVTARTLEPVDYREFVAWLGTMRGRWTQTTWRQRRAQVSHWMETRPHAENQEAFEMLGEVSRATPAKPRRLGETSARKPKMIAYEDWLSLNDKLTEWGQRANFKYAYATRVWLHANILLGLRPVEWLGTTMKPVGEPDDDGRVQFQVAIPNAKTTNGRGTGPQRELEIQLTPEQAEIVRTHLEVVAGIIEDSASKATRLAIWRDFEGRCNRTLARACEVLWPNMVRRRYTLYSARHQFAANAKSDHPLKIVAELMGHKSPISSERHYGQRKKGWSQDLRSKATPVSVTRPFPKTKETE